ncbi:MAG: carbohydrate ABC transporter permease [Treponema sp.]|nr:carbohydrate ABC transporter permease [Treponema sp.]
MRAMKVRTSLGDKIFDAFNLFIMFCLIVVIIYPILNVIAVSFSDALNVGRGQITIYPKGFTTEAYHHILKDGTVWIGYRNSIFYSISSTLIMLLLTSMFAYPLALRGFALKKVLTVYLAITMFFSGGMIPTFLLMRNLNLINNPLAIIVPGAVGAWNVFIFRTFFQSLPVELIESAKMDGANDFSILFKIVLPLSKALLATFGLFGIVGMWNNWFSALIYLTDRDLHPLQLILREYLYVVSVQQLQARAGMGGGASNPALIQQLTPRALQMAMVVVTMFPIMAIYPFFQKHFVKGVMIGAIKG